MATITLPRSHALAVFHTVAEGIAEVRRDDEDPVTADALIRLITVTGMPATEDAAYPLTITLPDDLVEVANDTIETCLFDSEGMKPTDDDADDHLFAGQVMIAKE